MLSTCLQPPHKLSSSHAWCVLVLVLAKRCFANASGSTCSLQSANHVCMHICMASLSTSPLIEHGRLCVEKLTAISSALVYVIPETDYYTEDAACVCLQVALFFVIGCLLAIRGSTGVVATYPSKARTVPFVLQAASMRMLEYSHFWNCMAVWCTIPKCACAENCICALP